MGMSVGSSDDNSDVMVDINTTPLIDVMLVLLIMLIITIPAQLHSVNMDLPNGAPPAKKVDPIVVKVDVDASGVVFWNGQALQTRPELDARLSEAYRMQPQPELHIRAQGKAKYEAVAGVLASAQRIGLTKLGIVGTEQFAN